MPIPAGFVGAGPVVWNPTTGWPATQTITEDHLPEGTEVGDRLIMVITYRTTLINGTSLGPCIVFTPLEDETGPWRFIEAGEINKTQTSGTRVYTEIYGPEVLPVTLTAWDSYHNVSYYDSAGLGADFDIDPVKRIWAVQLFTMSPASTHIPDSVGLPYTEDLDNDYIKGKYNHESPGIFPDGNPLNLTVPWFDINKRNSVGDGNSQTGLQASVPIYTGPNFFTGHPGSDPQRWKVNLNTGLLIAIGVIDFGEIGTGNFTSGYEEFSLSNGFHTVYVRDH